MEHGRLPHRRLLVREALDANQSRGRRMKRSENLEPPAIRTPGRVRTFHRGCYVVRTIRHNVSMLSLPMRSIAPDNLIVGRQTVSQWCNHLLNRLLSPTRHLLDVLLQIGLIPSLVVGWVSREFVTFLHIDHIVMQSTESDYVDGSSACHGTHKLCDIGSVFPFVQ